MKFFKILCSVAILCIFVLAALSCKTNESAYEKAYLKAQMQNGNASDASSLTGK